METKIDEAEEDREQTPDRVLSRRRKHMTTVAIVLGNVCTGTAYNTYSPALVDLKNKYETTIDEISVVFTILTIGYLVGGIATGFAYKFINRQLGIILLHTGTAAAMYFTPHCPSTTTLFCAGGVLGFCAGAYDASQVVWMMEMWQSEAGPYILAQGVGWGVGNFVPPLLLAPFLTAKAEDATGIYTTTTVRHSPRNPDMYIPFTIAGALMTLMTTYQIFLFTFHRYFPPPPDTTRPDSVPMETRGPSTESVEVLTAGTGSPGRDWRRIKLILLTALFLGGDQGLSMCTHAFFPTFVQYGGLGLSQREAAYLSSGMNGVQLGGRILGVLVVLKVPAQYMFCTNLGIQIATNGVLLLFGDRSVGVLWACAVGLGLGMSTINSSFTAFIERHLLYTNGVGAIIFTFGSLVAAIYPIVIGKYIEERPSVLMYTNFFSLFWMVLATVLLFRMTICRNKKI